MPTEDSYLPEGPARRFKEVTRLVRRGAEEEELLPEIMLALRRQLRGEGPAGLVSLAARTGVGGPGRLSLPCLDTEIDRALQQHQDQGVRDGRLPGASCEVRVVLAEWVRLQQPDAVGRSLGALYTDYCLALLSSGFLAWVERSHPVGDPAARLARVLALEAAVRERLRGEDADIIESLHRDSTGGTVRKKAPRPAVKTADVLHVPAIPVMPEVYTEMDLEVDDGDESGDVPLQLHDRF